ncbi:5-methyltetrahydropteroyltriglutamate--homocysteine S-methyltransferase [Lactococcus kimchii]|uniref:5-methyltetrahydropteroyltriglutamate-- homocysteine S-methyltransferase n=1 Tax=Lactococcus sp. S-13 TaxID=2507158 RepID=UPI0010232D9B|nr:5-methyltetrahydropteroyltriglutamate--homocysteine S-methyltransferase [Lactococcus sp. S-13]RZI48647.1 5-methyltetrahydropteroyltriglutamate--homocysteine S-methyltransferase [Lactococcus sp. S-13]
MKTSIIGFPRIGAKRELKFATESYFKNQSSQTELLAKVQELKSQNWKIESESQLNFIPSNDFSLYDNVLDVAFLLNIIPKRYRNLGLDNLDTYFAAAKGYQGKAGDVKALPMKKWFNTNYHYLVPEIEDDAHFELVGTKIFDDFSSAKNLGYSTKPVLIGPFTFLKLATYKNKKASDFATEISNCYIQILEKLNLLGADWFELDEPALVKDLSQADIALFNEIYKPILSSKGTVKVLLQTYFGDVRDIYEDLINLSFDGIGIDFIEGKASFDLIKQHGFPSDKTLFAGLVNGKNIWRNNYQKTLDSLDLLSQSAKNIVLSTSCSLQHVPVTVTSETNLEHHVKASFSFATEKLDELEELAELFEQNDQRENSTILKANQELHQSFKRAENPEIKERLASLTSADHVRTPIRSERLKIQKKRLKLPLLPTTTIGSFPQTPEVRVNRKNYRTGEISKAEYEAQLKSFFKEVISLQEDLGLDVLVHGEFERNDMVEYFGENLSGYVFTKFAWVQSYGTRCVKPPIIFGDIQRERPITVETSAYAQSLTSKPMKAMLTGPITILNWSFPREDINHESQATQIALAIRDEVLDLEAAGLPIIQIDEAALREKLPLRQSDWYSEYLDWAIPTFRLTHSGVKPETQIHTHMCYSEFEDIIQAIDNLDADVISFEASRSSLDILRGLKANHFETEVGPGVYDIHSPRVPSIEEIEQVLHKILQIIPQEQVWVNPDCGLKTRRNEETIRSLKNLVLATKQVRTTLVRNETL